MKNLNNLTEAEAKDFIEEQVAKSLQGFVGQSSSTVTAEAIKNAVMDSVKALIADDVFKPRKFDVRVELNGPQVDVAIVDPETGEVLDLKDFIYQDN